MWFGREKRSSVQQVAHLKNASQLDASKGLLFELSKVAASKPRVAARGMRSQLAGNHNITLSCQMATMHIKYDPLVPSGLDGCRGNRRPPISSGWMRAPGLCPLTPIAAHSSESGQG